MLPRTLEPELMDSEEEARDYDAMDHREVNARFCDDFVSVCTRRDWRSAGRTAAKALDAGTGTALIAIELARRLPELEINAFDLAEHMLLLANRNVERAGLAGRVHVRRADAKRIDSPTAAFDAVLSNSLVHHIAEPRVILEEMWRVLAPCGILFVRDLVRPESADRARELVNTYAPQPQLRDRATLCASRRQRALLEASLHAALTVDEVRSIAARIGIPVHATQQTSDRHWTLAYLRP